MKCIDIKSNAFKVPLLIWLLTVIILIGVHPVKAETGNITIASSPALNYFQTISGSSVTTNWSRLLIDQADYNNYGELDLSYGSGVTDYHVSLARPSNFTSFTWYSGIQSGTGMFSYHTGTCTHVCANVTWVFNGLITNPRSPFINISYQYPNVPAEITDTGTLENNCGINCTAYPFTLTSNDLNTESIVGQYRTFTGVSLTNSYNITYPSAGKFQATITKDTVISTQDYINSSTIEYTGDTTFNKNILNFYGDQADGIYINVTTATGLYSNILINSTNIVVAPTPTPPAGGTFNPPLTIPSSGGSVQFNQTKYVVGDTVRVEWAISNTDWNGIGQTFAIGLFQDNLPMTNPSGFSVGTQTGNFSWKANTPSSIKAELDGGFLFATNTLATAYTSVVAEQQSTVIAPANVPIGKNFSVTYMYGFTPFAQTYADGVYIVDSNGAIKGFVSNPSITALQSYSVNMTVPSAGTYTVELKDFSRGIVATTQITASLVFVPPTLNILTSYLTLDSASYNLGDLVSASYGIDNTNYSNYNIYYRVSNYTTGKIFNHQMPAAQQGTFKFNTYDGIDQFDLSNYQIPVGINRVGIRASNSSSDFEIAFANFTFSRINLRGYSLEMSKHGNDTICQGETIYAKVTFPYQSTAVNILVSNTGKLVYSANYSNSTTIPIRITTPDIYLIDVISNIDNTVQALDSFTVSNCAAKPTGTPGQVQSGGTAWNSASTNLLSLIAMPAFWGLLLFLAVIIACATNPKAAQSTGVVAFIFANIEAVVGLWSPFTWYILVITWIIAGIYFKYGRDTTTGVQ